MKAFLLAVLAVSFLVFGCCGATTPSGRSGSCPYGTYGETCSEICSRLGEPNCVSRCLDGVRSEGLGDATTCCPMTLRQSCESLCADLGVRTQSAEAEAECMDECLRNYESFGIDTGLCYVPL